MMEIVLVEGVALEDAAETLDHKAAEAKSLLTEAFIQEKVRSVSPSCNCGESDINSSYRQCLVSMRSSTTYFTALTLFDTGAYTSFVNREVVKWQCLDVM